MKLLPVFSALLILILERVSSYDLTATQCQSSYSQQSPVNISTADVKYYEEKFFRIIAQNFTSFNSTWQKFPEEKTIGFSGSIGYLIFVKDWAMYKFDLKNVYIRYGSGHRIDGKKYDMEIEFVFDLDDTYRSPGRYIYPTAEKLIISYFFTVDPNIDDKDQKYTLLFNYTNLETFAADPTAQVGFTKAIKFNKFIRQQPSYFYEGATTSGNCETAWRVIMPKYQLVPKTHYDNIRSILNSLGYLETVNGVETNSRNIVPVNSGIVILTNDNDSSRLLIEASVDQYDRAFGQRVDVFVFAAMLLILLLA